MRQAALSNTVTATYDEENETFAIRDRYPRRLSTPETIRRVIILHRDEMSNLIDFVMETTKKKLAFYCHRCQPNQRFDNLKGLVDHSEQAHLVHLVDLQRRLQGEA